MVREVATDCVCAGLLESFTIAEKVAVPPAVGVPEITPVLSFRFRPTGKLPDAIDQVYGEVPPLTCNAPA
jgi:hypothetical protein